MIGMLSAWRGDRKEGHDRKRSSSFSGGMGGLVSIEELKSRTEKPSRLKLTGSIKKTPKLNLARRSLALKPRDTSQQYSPPLHDMSLFENIPAIDNPPFPSPDYSISSRPHSRRPSVVSEHLLAPVEPLRPKTADPLMRKRSKTTPPAGNTIKMSPDWDEKPLPLAIDIDARKKEYAISDDIDGRLRIASPVPRPKTTDNAPRRPSIDRTSSKGSYSLMPNLTSSIDSRRGSRSTIASRGISNGSTSSPSRFRLRSRSSSQTSTLQDAPLQHPSVRNSILDEVEGTLTATITELQELQSGWHQEHGARTSSRYSESRGVQTPMSGHIRTSSQLVPRTDSCSPAMPLTNSTQSMPPTPAGATFADNGLDPRLQNWQLAYHEQKKAMNAVAQENSHVKQHLVNMKSRLAEFEDEKALLAQATKEAEENLQLILKRLKEAKVNEMAAQNEFHAAKNEVAILTAKYDEEKRKNAMARETSDVEKKQIEGLQAKLEDVNTQKVDLLEANLDQRQEIAMLKKQLQKTMHKFDEAKRQNSASSNASTSSDDTDMRLAEALRRNELLAAELQSLSPHSDLPAIVAERTFRLEDMQRQLHARDQHIRALQARDTASTKAAAELQTTQHQLQAKDDLIRTLQGIREEVGLKISTAQSTNDALEQQVAFLQARLTQQTTHETARRSPDHLHTKIKEMQEALTTARIERDQFSTLLHAEIRRATIEDHGLQHPSLPFLQKKLDLADAIALVRSRASAYLKKNNHGSQTAQLQHDGQDVDEFVDRLESEIEYYLNDIVLYKLDVRGYKKDLRRARERIRELGGAAKDDFVV